jgi:hypothetical protein
VFQKNVVDFEEIFKSFGQRVLRRAINFPLKFLSSTRFMDRKKPGKPDKNRKFSASRSVQRIGFWILPIIQIPYRQQSFGMLENDILKKPSKFNFKL